MDRAFLLLESALQNGSIKLAEPDDSFTVEELVKMDCAFLELMLVCLED